MEDEDIFQGIIGVVLPFSEWEIQNTNVPPGSLHFQPTQYVEQRPPENAPFRVDTNRSGLTHLPPKPNKRSFRSLENLNQLVNGVVGGDNNHQQALNDSNCTSNNNNNNENQENSNLWPMYRPPFRHDLRIFNKAKDMGLVPKSLGDVLAKRNKKWAKTQCIHAAAVEEFNMHLNMYKDQFKHYPKPGDGWILKGNTSLVYQQQLFESINGVASNGAIDKVWSNVIYCPSFKPGGEIVRRFARNSLRLYRNLYDCLVNGWIHPGLVVCEIVDASHPVRFATPSNEYCYTVMYAGPEVPADHTVRVIFGEYTGLVFREDCIPDSIFEYAFELTFSPDAWLRAEMAHDEGEGPISQKDDTVYLPHNARFVLDSSHACNELSLVNHYQTIRVFGGERWSQPNCEWQQVFMDGWPHVVLTSKPGVRIRPGDELVADFGALWFSKVEETAHRCIRRELSLFRTGNKRGPVPNQLIPECRQLDDVDNELISSASATVPVTCTLCKGMGEHTHNGDKQPVAEAFAKMIAAEEAQRRGIKEAAQTQVTSETQGKRVESAPATCSAEQPKTVRKKRGNGHFSRNSGGNNNSANVKTRNNIANQYATPNVENYPETPVDPYDECISCDGCDRIFHLGCLKNIHNLAATRLARINGRLVWIRDCLTRQATSSCLKKWYCPYCRSLAKQIYANDLGCDFGPFTESGELYSPYAAIPPPPGASPSNDDDNDLAIDIECDDAESEFGNNTEKYYGTGKVSNTNSGIGVDVVLVVGGTKEECVENEVPNHVELEEASNNHKDTDEMTSPDEDKRPLELDVSSTEKPPTDAASPEMVMGIKRRRKRRTKEQILHDQKLLLQLKHQRRRQRQQQLQQEEPLRQRLLTRPIPSHGMPETLLQKRLESAATAEQRCKAMEQQRILMQPRCTFSASDLITDLMQCYSAKNMRVKGVHGPNGERLTRQKLAEILTNDDENGKVATALLESTSTEIKETLVDYLGCRYLNGMWQLDPFAQFGECVKACEECHRASGVKANVYVCRIIKRHLSGNYDHPQNTNPTQMKELILLSYEQQMTYILRLLVLKNVVISFLTRLCCHFIGRQLFHEKRTVYPPLPFPFDFLNMPSHERTPQSTRDIENMPGSEAFVVRHVKGANASSVKETEGNNEVDNTDNDASSKANENAGRTVSNGRVGLTSSETRILKNHLSAFATSVTNLVTGTSKKSNEFSLELLNALGAFEQEYYRLVNCTTIVDYINDLTSHIAYDADQVPANLQCLLTKDELTRFNNFRHVAMRAPSLFAQSLNNSNVSMIQQNVNSAKGTNGAGGKKGIKRKRPKEQRDPSFFPLLGIHAGASIVYRRFADGYYQGRVLILDDLKGIFRIEYSDGDDECIRADELLEEYMMNLCDTERLLNELARNDVRNEPILSEVYKLGGAPQNKIVVKLRNMIIKSIVAPNILQPRQKGEKKPSKKSLDAMRQQLPRRPNASGGGDGNSDTGDAQQVSGTECILQSSEVFQQGEVNSLQMDGESQPNVTLQEHPSSDAVQSEERGAALEAFGAPGILESNEILKENENSLQEVATES